MVASYKQFTAFSAIVLSITALIGCEPNPGQPPPLTTVQLEALKAKASREFPGCTVQNLNQMPCHDSVSAVWCAHNPAAKKYYIIESQSSTTWYSVSEVQSHLDHAEKLKQEASERLMKLTVNEQMMCVPPASR